MGQAEGAREEPVASWRFVCPACGSEVGDAAKTSHDTVLESGEPGVLRCPRAGTDDGDHLLRRELEAPGERSREAIRSLFTAGEAQPFSRYRALLASYAWARRRGISDSAYREIVAQITHAMEEIDGRRLHVSPCVRSPGLSRALGFNETGGVWIKDETNQPAGSHKVRHLMGILLWLEVADSLGASTRPDHARRPLAIASCGNAALAASLLARAAGRPLDLFVPEEAEPLVLEQIRADGARVHTCARSGLGTGDPCLTALDKAVREEAVAFTVQGNRNALAIEGGMTLGYEIIAACIEQGWLPNRVLVQVGGGALASAIVQSFDEAHALGLIERLPRFHAVQTEGCHPLERAHRLVSLQILERSGRPAQPDLRAGTNDAAARRADRIARAVPIERVDEALHDAATHRSRFMWPWEQVPGSAAAGILDDETYDWMAVTRGMLLTGGFPVVVSEPRLREAQGLAGRETTIPSSCTGTAGLAGLIELAARGLIGPGERTLVLFTGAPVR